MSTTATVRFGAQIAEHVIKRSFDTSDRDIAQVRLGLLEFLRRHAEQIDPGDAPHELVSAYRAWLETAVMLFSTGDETLLREYMHRGAVLRAELQLLPEPASVLAAR